MTLATRMWLLGAALPTLVMAIVLFGADRLFHAALEGSLDRALLAQAAVESASLFDGPRGEPHLHMATSPLVDSVRPFAPIGELFGPDGALVMRYPAHGAPHVHEHMQPRPTSTQPVLATSERTGHRVRALTVMVSAPRTGAPYVLRLTANLSVFDAATTTFHRLAIASVLVMGCVLVMVQALQGRALRRRLSSLSEHVQAIRAGELERELPADSRPDELAQLATVLAEATAALRAARDARARLVAEAAHELRTPLTLMRTGLDLALRRERSADELKSALRDAREEVDRLAKLASDLLDMASVSHEAEPHESCDVVDLVAAAVEAVRSVASERGLSIVVSAPSALHAPVRARALRRAVDNLISNALKHARSHLAIRVSALQPGWRIEVADDGHGIPDSERELVFEPFHRVAGSPDGAGLGLSIAREVAVAHGGRAYVGASEAGACIVLEAASVPAPVSQPPSS